MCRLVTVCYTCPEPCGYNNSAWETHCQYTGRDNIQGGCGRTDNAGFRRVNYPCPHHRGLDFDFIAGNVIGQTGRDLGRPTWQNFPDSGSVHHSAVGWAQTRQLEYWLHNQGAYERDAGMPADLNAMTRQNWEAYFKSIHNPNTKLGPTYGNAYAQDPRPWGDARD